MSIATDIATANSTIASSLATITAQLVILEADQASDPHGFAVAQGPQAAGGLLFGILALKPRCDKLVSDNR